MTAFDKKASDELYAAIKRSVIAEKREGAVETTRKLLMDLENSRITYVQWAKRIVDAILREEG